MVAGRLISGGLGLDYTNCVSVAQVIGTGQKYERIGTALTWLMQSKKSK